MREYTVTYQQEVTRKVQAASITDAARLAQAWCTSRMRVMSIFEMTSDSKPAPALPAPLPAAPDSKPDGV